VHYTIQYSLLVLFVGDSGYCGTCCCACLACQLSDRLDEHTFLPLCIGIVPLRQKIRMMFGIRVRSTPKRSSPPGAKLEPGRCQSVCRTRAPEKKPLNAMRYHLTLTRGPQVMLLDRDLGTPTGTIFVGSKLRVKNRVFLQK